MLHRETWPLWQREISESPGVIDPGSLLSAGRTSLFSYIGTTHDCSSNREQSKNVLVPKWAKETMKEKLNFDLQSHSRQRGSVSTLFMALW